MAEIKLTKDSDYLICSLYKSYIEKRSNGMSKLQASCTGSAEDIQKELFPNWSLEDVDATCRELDRAGMLQCFYADDMVYESTLSDQAIIYMENRFERNINTVMDYIAKIKSMIPFI